MTKVRLVPNRPLKKDVLGKRYEIVFTRKVNRGNMGKTPVAIWLFTQGYHSTSLPPVVTWYAPGKELRGRTDPYTLDLYRSKGYVLDKRYLNPILWEVLETKGAALHIRHSHTGSRLAYPCELIIEGRWFPEEEYPREKKAPGLASSILSMMDGRDAWEGTASELLTLIGPDVEDLPSDAIRLAAAVLHAPVMNELEVEGIRVHKKRTMHKRLLVFSR